MRRFENKYGETPMSLEMFLTLCQIAAFGRKLGISGLSTVPGFRFEEKFKSSTALRSTREKAESMADYLLREKFSGGRFMLN